MVNSKLAWHDLKGDKFTIGDKKNSQNVK